MNFVTKTFETGYNKEPWTYSRDFDDVFYIDAKVTRPIGTVREECIIAAKEIADKFHQEEIHIVYSGGRDSEITLEAFRLAGIPIKAIMVRASNGLNNVELSQTFEYTLKTGFNKFDILDFDHLRWINSEKYKEILRTIQCPFSSFLWYLKPVIQKYHKKVLVLSPMEPNFALVKGMWTVAMPEYEYSVFKYFDRYGLNGVPSFFCWSGELWNSFFLQKAYWQTINGKAGKEITNSNQVKGRLLFEEFGLVDREKILLSPSKEFWSDYNSFWTRIYSHSIKAWLAQRGLWQRKQK